MPPAIRAASPATVEWTVSPWREDPVRAVLAVSAALLLWILVAWLVRENRLLSTLMGLATLAVLAPGMAPTQCRVDGHGVARRVLFAWERRTWTEIRRARVGVNGLFVSPFVRRSRLDRFRGLFLPVPRRAPGTAPLIEALRREVVRHGL
jgi:hypothetical protein